MIDAQTLIIAILVFLALAIGAFAKGATGLGLPFIAMPLLAQIFGVEHAVAIMVVPGVISNGWLVWVHRRHARASRPLGAFLVVGLIGGVAGAGFLSATDPSILLLCLAAALGVYLVFYFFNPRYELTNVANRALAPPVGFAAGAVQSVSGVSAPLIAPYIFALGLRKNAYVFAVALSFTVFGFAQLAAYFYFEILTPARFLEGALALPPVLVFLFLGVRFADKIDAALFEKIVLFIFVLLEAKLIFDGVSGILR